jgi:cytochrome P450
VRDAKTLEYEHTIEEIVGTMPTLSDLPGPKGLPLLGNLLQINFKQLHRVLERWCDDFGTFYAFKLGLRPVVVVADPELIQHILRNRPKLYRRLGTIEPITKEMGINGVFSAEGDDWRRQRGVIAHALDVSHLREFFPTLIKVTERLKNRWNRAADKEATVNVQEDLMRYTVDVTANLAFGYDMNTLEKEGDVIQEHLAKIFPMIDRRINTLFPYWRYFKLPADRALDKSLVAIRETIDGFIARARARLAQTPELAEHPTNLLEAMLSTPDEGDKAFTDEEIYGNMLTILLGGEETTASTMAWMMHFMIEHPRTQARMRIEAAEVVGNVGMLSQVQDTERLHYIEALAHETMRLKPAAPLIFLESIEDVTIGGVAIPKKTALMMLTLRGGLQETYFADADQFRPERWLEQAQPRCAHNTRAFVPFGAGPRFCPGRQLAMMEIKTVMAMLCTAFEVSKGDQASPVNEIFAVAMMPESLPVRLHKRRSV